MVVQHGLGASNYTSAAGLILPQNQIESKPAIKASKVVRSATGAVSEMHCGYPELRAPVRD